MVQKYGYDESSPDVIADVRSRPGRATRATDRTFANARLVGNLVDSTSRRQALRIERNSSDMQPAADDVLMPEDVSDPTCGHELGTVDMGTNRG